MVIVKATNVHLLGGTIANRRKMLGMSQAELADASGVDQSMISYIESGKRIPSLINMVSVLSALDMVLKIDSQQ